MRTSLFPAIIGCLAAVMLAGCRGDGKSDLERRYEQVRTDMTEDQVTGILGQGRVVTAAALATYAEHPKFDTKNFPATTKWLQWDGKVQYVLAGFSGGKLVVCRLVGAKPPAPK